MSNFLKDIGQPIVYRLIHPLILLLHRLGITPNTITTIGFLLNILAAGIFIYGAFSTKGDMLLVAQGGAMILFAGLFDMIDGRLARISGTSSVFGALYDSVLDRYSELVMFLGICTYLVVHQYYISALLAFAAMIGSIMVSYVRARAEGLGIACSDGLMQRPERILLIGISALLCGLLSYWMGPFQYFLGQSEAMIVENISIFTFPLGLLAVLANYTAWQRLQHCKKALAE